MFVEPRRPPSPNMGTRVGAPVYAFDVIGQRIDRILDYIHCPWVIEAATTVTIGELPLA